VQRKTDGPTTRPPRPDDEPTDESYRVEDRRHWTRSEDGSAEGAERERDAGPRKPSLIEEYRQRTEAAEAKLHEYIEAYKRDQAEQEAYRARLSQDIGRRVELEFGSLVADLLPIIDDLDRAVAHAANVRGAEPLADGIAMSRSRFLAGLEAHGITKVEPHDVPFDPNEAEAIRVDPVDDPDLHNVVTETLQPGYRLGDRVLRPARVAVGRYTG
jgi:molecular chaperone GrpE (heat shock protein)